MNTFIALLVITVTVSAYSPHNELFDKEWKTFKARFKKVYSSDEDIERQKLFYEKKLFVAEHNQKYYNGEVSHMMGINKFSDMLPLEMSRFKGLKFDPLEDHTNAATFIPPPEDVKIPDSIDWRTEGAVTPVKNQRDCGSCWAFSATGALEGQHFRKSGKLVSLSEQNLVDCDTAEYKCQGGWPYKAFMYIKNNKGIDTEQSYPYTSWESDCKFDSATVGATDLGYSMIKSGSEEDLKKAVATLGPISVAIDADGIFFTYYEDGVYYNDYCYNSTDNLDHAVLVVGYGTTDKKEDYWIVKNSWGTDWGLKGYILMARNRDNNCGIATEASYPLV